jgi:cytochrome b6-f complex iron-sulfur subunit
MPLIDDLRMPLSDDERDRRALLGLLASGAFAAAAAGTGVTAVRFMWPEVLFEQETRFRIGAPDTIPTGTVLVLLEQKAYVVRTEAGFFAMSATCTHLGCLTRHEKDQNRIFCPCHGSRFDENGAVTNGPAPLPLPRLALTLEDGSLVLDVSRPAPPDALLTI